MNLNFLLCAYRDREEGDHLVGWPPIKSWRKKELHQQPHPAGGQIRNDRIHANKNQSRGANTLYVKVNMEGVAIGRKIDLRLYDSYQTLTNTLISMFAKCKWRVLQFVFPVFLWVCAYIIYIVDLILLALVSTQCNICADQKFEEDDGASYTLTFQNEQGDWMLAGHVPWQYVHIFNIQAFIDYFVQQKFEELISLGILL